MEIAKKRNSAVVQDSAEDIFKKTRNGKMIVRSKKTLHAPQF
jgi:hypothetical protein